MRCSERRETMKNPLKMRVEQDVEFSPRLAVQKFSRHSKGDACFAHCTLRQPSFATETGEPTV